MSNAELMSIGEASRLTGVHVKALRYYDRMDAFVPEYVDPKSGYRYYGFDRLQGILAVRICLDTGIVLGDLGKYRKSDSTDYVSLLQDAGSNIDKEIELLKRKKDYIDLLRNEISLNVEQGIVVYNNEEYGSLAFWRMEISDEEAEALSKKEMFLKLSVSAKKKGYQISPLYYGTLMEFAGGERRLYAIASLTDFLQGDDSDKNVYYLPRGKYMRKEVDDIDASKAEKVFPELFDKEYNGVALVTAGIGSKGSTVFSMAVRVPE